MSQTCTFEKIQVKLNTTQISAWLVCRNFSRINFSRVWTLFPWNLITRKIFTLHRIIHLACSFLCNLLFFIVMISSLGAFALGAILQKSLYAHWKKKTGSWSKEGLILHTWIKKGKFLIKRNWSYWDEISQWTFHEVAPLVHCYWLNWNLKGWFLWMEENWRTQSKTLRTRMRTNNNLYPHWHQAGNQTWGTIKGGKWSHHFY